MTSTLDTAQMSRMSELKMLTIGILVQIEGGWRVPIVTGPVSGWDCALGR